MNAGAGYAISINQIRNFLGDLRSGRIVDHASLGATVSRDSHGAIVVSQILDESDAYRRGLRVDDEIVSFAGRPIHSVNQFKNVLGIFPEAWKVALVYRRDGEKHEIRVRLRSLHAKSEMAELSAPEEQPPDERPSRPAPFLRKVPRTRSSRAAPPRRPRDGRCRRPEAEVSEKLKALYAARPGFRELLFQPLELARVLRGLDAWGDFHSRPAGSFPASTAAGAPFRVHPQRHVRLAGDGRKNLSAAVRSGSAGRAGRQRGPACGTQPIAAAADAAREGVRVACLFRDRAAGRRQRTWSTSWSRSLGSVECRWYFSAADRRAGRLRHAARRRHRRLPDSFPRDRRRSKESASPPRSSSATAIANTRPSASCDLKERK